tara:strand:+ start:881 stop:1804 length:924 start_codon:yes stop_codon:yes gene_type:complete
MTLATKKRHERLQNRRKKYAWNGGGGDDDDDNNNNNTRYGDGRKSGESETRFHDVSEYLSSSDEVNESDYDIDELLDGDYFDSDVDDDFFDTRSRSSTANSARRTTSSSSTSVTRKSRKLGELPDETAYKFWSTAKLRDHPCVPYCTWRLNDENDMAQNGGRDILLVRMGAANSELSHENKQLMDQVMVSTLYHGIKTRLLGRDYRTVPGQIDVLIDMQGCGLTKPPPFDVIARGLSAIGELFYERAKVHRIGNPPRGTQILINAVMALLSKEMRDSVKIVILRDAQSDEAMRRAYEAKCLVSDSMK